MSPPRSHPRSRASTGSPSGPKGSRRARPPRSSASSARSTPPTSGSPAAREPRVSGAPAVRRRCSRSPREPCVARPARPGALRGQVEPPRRAREPRRDHARGGGARGRRGVRPRDPGGGRRRHRGAHRARRGRPHSVSLRPRGLPRVSGVHAPRAGQRRRRRAVDRDRPGRRAGHDRRAPGHGPAGPGARERRPRVKVAIVTKRLDEVAADALVVGLYAAEKTLPDALVRLDRAAGGHLKAALEAESFKAKAGQVMHVHTGKSRVVVAGLGPRAEMTLEVLRRGAAAALRRARDLGARTVAAEVLGDRLPAPQRAQALVEGALLGTYTFDRYKKEKPERAVEELRIVDAESRHGREIEEGARRGEVFARATAYARDLINAPANELSPSDLARAAVQLAKERRLAIHVHDRAECSRMGMGAFLGVAAWSAGAREFIRLTYPGPRRQKSRVARVGHSGSFRPR